MNNTLIVPNISPAQNAASSIRGSESTTPKALQMKPDNNAHHKTIRIASVFSYLFNLPTKNDPPRDPRPFMYSSIGYPPIPSTKYFPATIG